MKQIFAKVCLICSVTTSLCSAQLVTTDGNLKYFAMPGSTQPNEIFKLFVPSYATEIACQGYFAKMDDETFAKAKHQAKMLAAIAKEREQQVIEINQEALKSKEVDTLKSAEKELTAASHKIAEEMYKQASAQQQPAGAGASSGPKKDDTVDAEYKVEDDK